MRECGSFTIPVMHYWSLPCVIVSDEGWCIVDRLPIELSLWLQIHYIAWALNFNYTIIKKIDIQYSGDYEE